MLCTSGFVNIDMFFTQWAVLCIMSCVFFGGDNVSAKTITACSVSDKHQQVDIVNIAPGVKSAIYHCPHVQSELVKGRLTANIIP